MQIKGVITKMCEPVTGESALLSSLRNIANQNNLRKDTIKRANLQNWKFAFAFTA